jgi:hypothetical protein
MVQERLDWLGLPPRPRLTAPQFGSWLKQLWKGHSYEQVALKLRPHVEDAGLKVDRSSIKKLEQGRVPNWPMLYAISRAFNVPMEEITAQLTSALGFSRDLIRHSSTTPSHGPEGGAADGTATARIRQLEARLEQLQTYEAIVRQVRPLLQSALVAIGEESGHARTKKTSRRGHH